jgi:hypothetical protein
MFSSIRALKKFHTFVKMTDLTSKSLTFYVYCQGATIDELSTLQPEAILQYQYFVIEEEKSMKLMTFVWFTKKKCRVLQLIEVNQFDSNLRKWMSSTFVIEKNRNFHGCELVIGVERSLPEMNYHLKETHRKDNKIFYNKSVVYEGYAFKVMSSLSEALNFKLLLNPAVPYNEMTQMTNTQHEVYYLYDNLSNDLVLKFDSNYENLYVTQLHVPAFECFAVPVGIPYNAYEKLIIPFDSATWILTLITFTVAFTTICAIYLMSLEVQNLVFGENVSTPFLNIFAHFFGLSQIVMPKTNFARYFVMMFVLLSFMIRTMYQGI